MRHLMSHVNLRRGRGLELMSLSDFLCFDESERALMVVRGRVEFLDDEGNEVPLKEALTNLREAERRSTLLPPSHGEAGTRAA
ncbi:MAG: hypothetical protein OEY14_15240 [Myxococcales bacterium]|nr:hypothetical protein [Myxococcales bacterium]